MFWDLVWIFWICDILNLPFMEMFDTTYPLNTLFWFIVFVVYDERHGEDKD